MKFSYSLIKKLVPHAPIKTRLIDGLNMKAFETEPLAGDAFDVKLPPNRYSDAASHWGVAREVAAVFDLKTRIEDNRIVNFPENGGLLKIKVLDKRLCPRYVGRLFGMKRVGSSPQWMQKILFSCGLRPINGVVDIMNYVMLETGQPLHAFDADEIGKGIVVRRAKNGEEITSLDGVEYHLNEKDIVIADSKGPLAIAGVKGGKRAEVHKNTKRIIVEAANFDQVSIYKTMKKLPLVTDASLRFSHGLNPHLAIVGMDRATVLLRNILGAELQDSVDVSAKLQGKKIIEFNVDKFNKLIGLNLDKKTAISYLKRLGFVVRDSKRINSFLVEPPSLRDDVNIFEDLAEEVARLCGYNNLPSRPPVVGLASAEVEDTVQLKDELRVMLVGLGFSEVYNYSFVGRRGIASRFLPFAEGGLLEIENPISLDRKFLRAELMSGLAGNMEHNRRLHDTLRLFEIGKVWAPKEELHLGLAIRSAGGESFLELKGAVQVMFERVGLTDFLLRPRDHIVFIESDHKVIGFVSTRGKETAFAELNLEKLGNLVSAEREFRPLPKYPAVVRDLSILVRGKARVGDVMEAIDAAGVSHIEDVDLLDYYDTSRFTFRVVFRAPDRTLTDEEVNREMSQIIEYLRGRFSLQVR